MLICSNMSFLFGNLSTLADRPCMDVSGRSLVQSILRSCNHWPTVIVLHVHYTCIHRLRTGALQLIASNYMYAGFSFFSSMVQLPYWWDAWCSSTAQLHVLSHRYEWGEGSVVLQYTKGRVCGALVQFGCCQQYYIAATNTDISECIKAPLLLGYM